jgi:glycosyltransferase involved in cell wall biosynthesis
VIPIPRPWLRAAASRGFALLRHSGLYRPQRPPVNYVIERADWAIRWVGNYVCDGIEARWPGTAAVTVNPAELDHHILHFGSQYMWVAWAPHLAPGNRFVVSFLHGKPEDSAVVRRHIERFMASVPQLDRIVTSSSLVEGRLLDWGVPRDALVRIPLGCDTEQFTPPTPDQRRAARAAFGIPEEAICIGTFQKDGVGWGDGMEPKLIKGPDVFVEAARRLSADLPVFVLLTGPARGFVKQGLEKNGIPFAHQFVQNYLDIVRCYHALDLYLVTSREEGGPLALMESMACHVPVVSTRVGQAQDLIEDGVTGGLVEVDDLDGLCARASAVVAADPEAAERQRREARRRVVADFDWRPIAAAHYQQVYRPLL